MEDGLKMALARLDDESTSVGVVESDSPGADPHRSDRRSVGVIVAASVLSACYIVYIGLFARNGIFWDDWTFVPIVDGAIHHHIDWAQLWQQHNENRELVPFLLVAGIGAITHLNTVVIEYLSAAMLVLSFILLIGSYRPFAQKPISIVQTLLLGVVWFSIMDTQNALWAFQIAWYFVLLCFVAMLYTFGRRQITPGLLMVGVTLAGLASFSSLQGLLLWPIGLFCIGWRVRGGRGLLVSAAVWVVAWAIATVVYFRGFSFSQAATGGGSTSYAAHHLLYTGQFVLALVGNVYPTTSPDVGFHEVLGAVLLAVAIGAVSVSMYSRRSSPILPLPAALLAFALLFDLTTAVGRVSFGVAGAVLNPRYSMANLLVLAALGITAFAGSHATPVHRRQSSQAVIPVVAAVLVGLMILVQGVISTDVGLQSAKRWNQLIRDGDTVMVQLDHIPEPSRSVLFNTYVFPSLKVATEAKWVAMVQGDHLGELAPHVPEAYAHSQLPPP